MLTAQEKIIVLHLLVLCEERKAFKKASELGAITFRPLLKII